MLFGDTYLSAMMALPSSAIVVNRTIGSGLGKPAGEALVNQIVSRYEQAGIGRYFAHLHPDAKPADLAGRFERARLGGNIAPPEPKAD